MTNLNKIYPCNRILIIAYFSKILAYNLYAILRFPEFSVLVRGSPPTTARLGPWHGYTYVQVLVHVVQVHK